MQEVSSDGCLVLDGALTVRNAADICATLLEKIRQHDAVSVDCSAATDVDLSFVQLLLAARQSAAASGNTVNLTVRPAGLLGDALTRGGFRVTPDDPADAGPYWFEGAAQ